MAIITKIVVETPVGGGNGSSTSGLKRVKCFLQWLHRRKTKNSLFLADWNISVGISVGEMAWYSFHVTRNWPGDKRSKKRQRWIKRGMAGDRVYFTAKVNGKNRNFYAVIGPGDTPDPVITIMFTDED